MSKIKEARRPLRCRWGLHALADSTLDREVGEWAFWETKCKRCDALLCYSGFPLIVNGKRVRR